MTMKLYLNCVCVFIIVISVNYSNAHYTQQWAVHIDGGSGVADQVAADHGFINHGLIFEDYYHFTHNKVAKRSLRPSVAKKVRLAADTRVKWAQQQKAKRRIKRDMKDIQDSDPKWPAMWYLNRGNGLDMNVIPAWLEGITGKGVVVTILDDGLEKDHPDLVQNYDPMASYDVNNQDPDPTPRYDLIDSNRHGTRCAGEVAATSNNSVCALGVAHGAQVGGVRMLDGDVTDAVEARSLSLNPHHIDIYSASWGPDDDGKTVDGPGELATRAFIEGVTKGRNGKGSIFVWASGNGGRDHDNCNCDGYTNSIYTLSISSATELGHVPWYSEACSSTLATTYSSGAVMEKQVVTTDLRYSCTSSHTGTSASAPLAAGICALALEANPNLTWRDMQHIVVRTARPQNLIAPDWQTNGVGRNVSHSFGYGLMDAHAMVQLARKWVTVPEQHKCEIQAPQTMKTIPPKSVVWLQLKVKECPGVEVLEHVQVKLTTYSQRRGDLNIQLTSPMGTRVTLLAHRANDNSRSGFTHWPFMSVHSWGESPIGTWQLEIHNDARLLGRATLQKWTIILYGTKSNHNNDKANSKKSNSKKKNNKKSKSNTNNNNNNNKQSGQQKSNFKHNSKKVKLNNNNNRTVNALLKQKRIQTTTDMSTFYYSFGNGKIKFDKDSIVKEYLKFIEKEKNISIIYPVITPIHDYLKPYQVNGNNNHSNNSNSTNKKNQKLKEKSRDINWNLNNKAVLTKSAQITRPTIVSSSNSKSTAISKGITTPSTTTTTAKVHEWELLLHGTSTPPAYDLQHNGAAAGTIGDIYNNEEIAHNSIDESPWKSSEESRKDTDEVVSKENRNSGCGKTSGNLCLECMENMVLHNGICRHSCPEGHYPSSYDNSYYNQSSSNLDVINNAIVCLQCHYSCRKCTGSLDNQCIECYSDATLYVESTTDQYCYPYHIMDKALSENWYHRVYIINILVIVIAVLYFIVKSIRKRTRNQRRQENLLRGERDYEFS